MIPPREENYGAQHSLLRSFSPVDLVTSAFTLYLSLCF